MEIERKFLLGEAPSRELLGEGVSIDQGYLPLGLRLRRMGDRYYLTIKGSGVLSREEWEAEIPAWVFDRLWPATAGRRLSKTRYEVEERGHTLEVDEYHGRLAGLWTLECEFASEEAARAFVPPAWVEPAVDVTADPSYRNASLAALGLPESAPVRGAP